MAKKRDTRRMAEFIARKKLAMENSSSSASGSLAPVKWVKYRAVGTTSPFWFHIDTLESIWLPPPTPEAFREATLEEQAAYEDVMAGQPPPPPSLPGPALMAVYSPDGYPVAKLVPEGALAGPQPVAKLVPEGAQANWVQRVYGIGKNYWYSSATGEVRSTLPEDTVTAAAAKKIEGEQ